MAIHDGPILVIGATGQQGGAVARELLRRGHPVRALVRAPDSAAAKELDSAGVSLAAGDLEDPASLRAAMAGVRGVFAMATFLPPLGTDGERRHGRAVAKAAKDTEVPHVVYSSVGGAERDTGIPHFESKWDIEQELRALDLPATVLRPAFFMENFRAQPPRLVDGTVIVRLALRPDTHLQMLATADVGVFAADAFERPEEHIGHAVELAGDQLTGTQIAETMQQVSGLPARFVEQPVDEVRAFSEDLALMLEWFNDSGYQADIAELRRRHPGLRTLADWLRESGWRPAETD